VKVVFAFMYEFPLDIELGHGTWNVKRRPVDLLLYDIKTHPVSCSVNLLAKSGPSCVRNVFAVEGVSFPVSRMIRPDRDSGTTCPESRMCISQSMRVFEQKCFHHHFRLTLFAFEANSQLSVIEESAFHKQKRLQGICLPGSLQQLSKGSFELCANLRIVHFERYCQLSVLDSGAFASCSSLAAIAIPNSVRRIESSCFYDCRALNC
jgi:hypothetical protein